MNNFVSFEDFKNRAAKKSNIETPKVTSPSKLNAIKKNEANISQTQTHTPTLLADLESAKRQNGLVEKIADKIKGVTKIGFSSKSIQNSIDNGENNEKIENDIKKYRKSQENIAQGFGDVVSCTAASAAFFTAKNSLLIEQAAKKINPSNMEEYIEELCKDLKIAGKKINIKKETVNSIIQSKNTVYIIGALSAALAGGLAKKYILKFNRFSTKQYKPEINKEMENDEKRQIKKLAKKERKNANRRNFFSGALNGLAMPALAVFGAVGAPVYALFNSLNRYFIASREDRGEKSTKSYVQNLKNSPLAHILPALLIALPLVKKGQASKIYDKNLDKVIKKLKNANLERNAASKSTYQQLEDILFGNEKIKSIIDSDKITTRQKVEQLSEENIFALKFKQIGSNFDDLSKTLKEDCPYSRKIDEAQEKIEKTFGKGKYTILKRAGAGTVAETYTAKDENGKEVCIKMLKEGIDAQKIEKDKKAFIEMVRNLDDKTPDEKEFLIKNIENIAQGVIDEVDFNNEMKAAQELKKVTKQAKVVKPIGVKDNIYVMEKADGVSLQTLMNYLSSVERCEWDVKYYKEQLEKNPGEYFKERYKEAQEKLQKVQEDTQELSWLGNITKDEAKKLLDKYQDVMVEQFSSVDGKEKIIHGDIHPGNIFIDMKALREGKKDFFTLIDTGNTIKQDSQTVLRFMNLTKYRQNADVDNIARYVLEGAKLPENMTQEVALQKVKAELSRIFFDDKTEIGVISNDTLTNITDGILQKLNIIPSDTQGNLTKSKTSANQSMKEFSNRFYESLERQLEQKLKNIGIDTWNASQKKELSGGDMMNIAAASTSYIKDVAHAETSHAKKQVIAEAKNLLKMPLSKRAKIKKSADAPLKNSEEYLTYQLKQRKKPQIKNLFEEEV